MSGRPMSTSATSGGRRAAASMPAAPVAACWTSWPIRRSRVASASRPSSWSSTSRSRRPATAARGRLRVLDGLDSVGVLEAQQERGAAARSGAGGLDRSAVQLRDTPGQRQADAQSTFAAGQRRVRLDEQVEDRVQLVRGNAGPVVGHADGRLAVARRDREPDRAAFRSSTCEALFTRLPTTCWSRVASPQTMTGRSGRFSVTCCCFASARCRWASQARLTVVLRSTGWRSSWIRRLVMRATSSRSSVSRARWVACRVMAATERRRAGSTARGFDHGRRGHDRGQGVPQLVAEHGQELVLGRVGGLRLPARRVGLLAGASFALERCGHRLVRRDARKAERDVLGHRGRQAHLVRAEGVWAVVIDHELPEQPTAGGEREERQGGDALRRDDGPGAGRCRSWPGPRPRWGRGRRRPPARASGPRLRHGSHPTGRARPRSASRGCRRAPGRWRDRRGRPGRSRRGRPRTRSGGPSPARSGPRADRASRAYERSTRSSPRCVAAPRCRARSWRRR